MKSLRLLGAALLLALALSTDAFAGEIIIPPAADGTAESPGAAGETQFPGVTGEIPFPGLALLLDILF